MSFLELEGLHVFVTGAAGGIGSAVVEEFLCEDSSRPFTTQSTSFSILPGILQTCAMEMKRRPAHYPWLARLLNDTIHLADSM